MAERAYIHLRRKIASGELPAGASLSEVSIAREIGVSRTPLREAIRQLAAEGLLRQTPNKGSVVVEFSKRDIAELYELREALEVYAAGKATEHGLRPEDIETLQQSLSAILALRDELQQSGKARLEGEQMQKLLQTDLNFHAVLVRAAANRRLLKAFADTRVLLAIFAIRRKGHDLAQLTGIYRYHSEVLAAAMRRDVGTAMRLLGEHINVSKQERLDEFDAWEHESVRTDPLPSFDEVGII